ncbi:tetratricopeptide repeat-containing sensor histidine kinase [Tenacibaculum sp. 190524A05c]|uniref:histidine kinase n=1 Tax=Tenacibaculum platacis TaxID=3137852 RepID=A0ABP1EFJ4_9FLAO
MFKKLIFLISFMLSSTLFPQKKDSLLYSKILEYSQQFKSSPNFKKAALYFSQKKWDSTLIYTEKQAVINSNSPKIIELYNYFRGISLTNKGIFEEAEKHLLLIPNNFKFNNIKEFYLAYIDMSLSKYEKAISHLLPLSKLPNENILYFDKNSILNNLALCNFLLNKYEKAEKYFEKINLNIKDSLKLTENYINTANLYYHKSQNQKAVKYFKKAYDLSHKLNFNERKVKYDKLQILEIKRTTAKNMSIIEEDNENFQRALIYRKEYEEYNDSISDEGRIYELGQKEKEFAVAVKQKEVDLLQVENKLKETERKIFLYSAIGLLLFLGIGAYFFREKVKTNKIIAAQKETLDELNTTKDKLFSIVSHDLRSSVNALKSSNKILLDNLASKNLEALENLLHKNSTIVNGAYGLLDNLLNWALMQTEQQYFSIEKQRLFIITEHVAYNYKPLLLEKELDFENTVSKKEFVQADQESLKIVLRNLIDNAIKFSQPNGFIKIYSSNTIEGYTNLIVEDSGLGMSDATRLKLLDDSVLLNKKEHEDIIGTGLGIQLVKSMIKKNNGKFDIESELGKGTKMIVSLPKTVLDG